MLAQSRSVWYLNVKGCDECAGAAEACAYQTEEDEDQVLLVRLFLVSCSLFPVLRVPFLCIKAQKLEGINERVSSRCSFGFHWQQSDRAVGVLALFRSPCIDESSLRSMVSQINENLCTVLRLM